MDVGQPSLDHLRIFLAVVDEGSFNGAAKTLGRAISVVSYGVASLEAQLGVTLFDREGSRRPVLTEAGEALVAEVRDVSDAVDTLRSKVRRLNEGLEPELALAIDVMMSPSVMARVLRQFQVRFPTVVLRLHVEALGAVASLLLDGRAGLAIGGPVIADRRELERRAIGSVELVPVAAPAHPLAAVDPIPPGAVRRHLQLVLTDRSRLTEGRDFSVASPHTWRLADLGAKHALILEGIGWGNMPRHLVADDIARGRLVELDVPDYPAGRYALSALWRKDTPPGPAGAWFLEECTQQVMAAGC